MNQLGLYILFGWLTLGLFACQEADHTTHAAGEVYTCPMHPQVVQDKPGTCPICKMDLVKTTKDSPHDSTLGATGQQQDPTLMLNDTQIKLANIRAKTIEKGEQSGQTVLTGTLAVDENRTETVSSRVVGRIERLYFKETGEVIRKGAPLFDVYSEQLQTLQNEYLLALAQRTELGDVGGRYSRLVEAATQKLRLLGMNQSQIDQLSTSRKIKPSVTFFSPQSGVIGDISVTEGQYVNEGTTLVTITDLTNLWVEAQIYPTEAGQIAERMPVDVQIQGITGTFPGKVAFLNPELEANSKILRMRVELSNPKGELRPGMQANVFLTQTKSQTIRLPLEAVLRDSKGSYVWKRTGQYTFAVAMVTTGAENAQTIEITQGLKSGDRVVVSGAYLLHSEYVLRKGTDPMASHTHSSPTM